MESLEQYMKQMTDSAVQDAAFREDIPYGEWRAKLTASFTGRLGGFPEERAALAPVRLERVACNGYIRERVEITTYEGLRMAMYLLIPGQPLSSPVRLFWLFMGMATAAVRLPASIRTARSGRVTRGCIRILPSRW